MFMARDKKLTSYCIAIIILSGLLVRFILFYGTPVKLHSDSINPYLKLATDYYREGVFISPLITPGYPLFINLCFKMFGLDNYNSIVLIQMLLGLMSSVAVFIISYKLMQSQYVSFFCAMLYNFNIQIISFENTVLSESLAILVFLILVYFLIKDNAMPFVLFALSILLVLIRPGFIYFLFLIPFLIF